MFVKKINKNIFNTGAFPTTGSQIKSLSTPDGCIGMGGNLNSKMILDAYTHGIFPWFTPGSPILWWCPDPRMIMYLDKFKPSKSLKQSIRNKKYTVKVDHDFTSVIKKCAETKRSNQPGGTWITDDMQESYINLHNEGYAHSFETYQDDELVGGLYGISLGKAFFGESMFHTQPDASKVAFYHLVETLKSWDFDFIDAQTPTNHLRSLGAEEVSRDLFLELLGNTLNKETHSGKWD